MTTDNKTSTGFIGHLHAFRGFAIVTIVAAHSWSSVLNFDGFATMPSEQLIYAVTETLFHGSTIYFALISGLLFSRVLRPRGWSAFFRSKALHVLAPYVIISLFLAILMWPMYLQWAREAGEPTNFFVVVPLALLRGQIQLQYWYIPVLLGLFVLTPLFDRFVCDRRLLWLAGALALAPLVVSRTPVPMLLSGPTFVYFAGAYVAGMLAGEYYDRVRELIAHHLVPLWTATIGCSAVLVLFFLNEYEPAGLISISEGLFYVQKLSIAALVLHWFARHEARLPEWLHVLGSYAFAIYFLHMIFVMLAGHALYELGAKHLINAYTAIGSGFVLLPFAIVMSLLISSALKKLFRDKSRIVIGA